jgi:alkylation response protein AidB-like acyl-CoA dehydrogenase
MDLAPSPEQQAVQEQARRFLTAQVTRERRLQWDASPAGYDEDFWRQVSELGWLGFGLPESVGGQGASFVDLALLMEECGRAAAPLGNFSAVAGGLALNALGSAAHKREWLPAVARGERRVALAVAEADAVLEPEAFTTTVRKRGARLRLAGEKAYVLQGVNADAFIVAARDAKGTSAVLVPAGAPGVRVEPLSSLARTPQSRVRFRDVELPQTALLGASGGAWPKLEKLRRELAALLCADLAGGADAVLAMTVAYVSEREQFGVKLGTFQAVQQLVANMAIDLEGARHVTRQACWMVSEGRKAEREVAIAKAWTARAYRDITLLAHQLHGGAGYVVEHELPRHTFRAKVAELLFGCTEEWMDDLAGRLRLGPG